MKKIIALLLVTALFVSLGNYIASKQSSLTVVEENNVQPTPVNWHDKALEKVVRNKLEKPTGDIYPKDLDTITDLSIWGITEKKVVSYNLHNSEYTAEDGNKFYKKGEIVSIEDLKLFKNLKNLTLCNQSVVDFSPLRNLLQLENLVLTGNNIKDFSFINQLKNLKILILDYNCIENLQGLAPINSLIYLDASNNQITDLNGIQNLKGLKTLIIDNDDLKPSDFTGISDIKLLGELESLEKLSMVFQGIKDLAPLSKLSGLTYLNLKSNKIEDLTPLSRLTNLKYLNLQYNDIYNYQLLKDMNNLESLLISNTRAYENLTFLRNLPKLKETDLREEEWKKVDYPFNLTVAEAIEGIYPGNIVNGGAVGFDGKNVYHEYISYGDLGHPWLVKFDNENYITQNMSGQITEQMSKITGQDPGGWINESISYLNIYKDKLYFIGSGSNNDTANVLQDGSYYPGNEVSGLTRMNQDGSNRVIIAGKCSYICVTNDRIFCLDKNNYPVSMNLDGGDVKVLLKKPCNMMYTDGRLVYYQLKGSQKYLYSMKMDGSQGAVLLKTNCNKPIIMEDGIYYLNEKGNICVYSVQNHENKIVSDCKANYYNLNEQYIYYSDKNGLCRIDKEGKNLQRIFTGYARTINIIGDYVFFEARYGYCKIKNDGSEYTEYFDYFDR